MSVCADVQSLQPGDQSSSMFQPLYVQTVMAQAMPTYTIMFMVDIVMSTAMSTIMFTAFELIYLFSGAKQLLPRTRTQSTVISSAF